MFARNKLLLVLALFCTKESLFAQFTLVTNKDFVTYPFSCYQQILGKILGNPFLSEILATTRPDLLGKDDLALKERKSFGATLFNCSKDKFKELEQSNGQTCKLADGSTANYIFVPGNEKKGKTLVVICPGLSVVDKMVAPQVLPYFEIFNKVLGYSCLYVPYFQHFGPNNADSKINLKTFSAGPEESAHLVEVVKLAEQASGPFDKKIGFGACFGGAVVAMAQHQEPIFNGLLFLSPLIDGLETARIILSNPDAFRAIGGMGKEQGDKHFKSFNRFGARWGLVGARLVANYLLPLLIVCIGSLLAKNNCAIHAILSRKSFGFMSGLLIVALGVCLLINQNHLLRLLLDLPLLNYTKYYRSIEVPTVFINSNFCCQDKCTLSGDRISPKDSLLNAIKTNNVLLDRKFNPVVFWSQGVGHLKNWAFEPVEFCSVADTFCSEPTLFVNTIFKSLAK